MRFGIIGNIKKPEVLETVKNISKYLVSEKVEFYIEKKLSAKISKNNIFTKKNILSIENLISSSDIIIACGGDGTILSTANLINFKEIPILGLNLGKLGFLTEASNENIYSFIKNIINHNYKIESRTVLEVSLNKKKYYGLNDVVIDKGISSRIVKIKSLINKSSLMDFIGDGIIISTPTGSTGYGLASGGPIVAPNSEVFVLNPICAHSLSIRSLVVPDNCEIEILASSENEKVRLTIDGQQKVFVNNILKVKIKKAKHFVKLIKSNDSNYYDVLRKKLFWSFDTRTIK